MRRAAAAAMAMAALAPAARAQPDKDAHAPSRDAGLTIAIPNCMVVFFTPAGIPVYSAGPARPPGDTSTLSLPGPAVDRGPEVGSGPESGSGPQLETGADAGSPGMTGTGSR